MTAPDDLDAFTETLSQAASNEELVDRPTRIEIELLSGPAEGRLLSLSGQRFTAGRNERNKIHLPDASVSSIHASLTLSEDGVTLQDHESRNGTWVGRARIQSALLSSGAEFSLGQCKMRLKSIGNTAVAITSEQTFSGLVGQSLAMRELFSMAQRLATTPLTALLLGETGTGKELFARALHEHSGRKGEFIVLDAGALPRELAEALILGHRAGAFTGAKSDQPGIFEQANGGTIFIDELGDLPLDLQPKLLRVLETRTVQRIGEALPRPVDVRIVAATHRDLASMVANREFRLDLYQRLAEVELNLPALRDRPEDIPLLAKTFLTAAARNAGATRHLAPSALIALRARRWPGNVRELKNCIQRAVYLSTELEITEAWVKPPPGEVPDESHLDEHMLDLPLKEAGDLVLEKFQRRYCIQVLSDTGGNITEASRRAGYSPKGFRDLLRRLGLRDDG